MAVAARRLAGDPLAGAVVEGGAAVERDRCLEAQPGPAPFHARDEADVELACSLADGAVGYVDHVDAGGGQPRRTLACHQRIRVAHGHDDAADAGGDESVRTRWRAAVVRARLERDDDRGAAHIGASGCRVAQCHHLRVRTAGLLRVAATGDAAVGSDDDAADPWIRLREAERLSGQCQRLAHEDVVWRRRGRGRRVVVHGSGSMQGADQRFVSAVVSGLMLHRPGKGRRRCRRQGRRRAGLIAAHDEEILPAQAADAIDLFPRMTGARIGVTCGAGIAHVAADAVRRRRTADRPARWQQGDTAGPASRPAAARRCSGRRRSGRRRPAIHRRRATQGTAPSATDATCWLPPETKRTPIMGSLLQSAGSG